MPFTKSTLIKFANANHYKHREAQPSGKHFLKLFTNGNVLARSFGFPDFPTMLAQDSIPISVSSLNAYISELERRGFVSAKSPMVLTFPSDTDFQGTELTDLWIDLVNRKKSEVFFTDVLAAQVPMLLPDGKGKWDVDPKSPIAVDWFKEILGDDYIAKPRGRNEGALKLQQRFENDDMSAAVPHAIVLLSDGHLDEAVKVLHAAAQEGNADAHAELGRLYLTGEGVPVCLTRAKHHYEAAAKSEHMQALHVLGTLYGSKGALETNMPLSHSYHKRAIAAGNHSSIAWLGNAYYLGYGVEQDIEEGLSYYRQGVEVLDGCCLAAYGNHLLRVKNDPEAAVMFYKASSLSGDHEGQFFYGQCLMYGWGCAIDYSKAVDQFQLSATSGYVPAMYMLGSCLYKGYACEKSYTEALSWLLKASDKGHAEAMCKAGVCFAEGNGVPVNCIAANSLFQDSGDNKYPYGYYLLARSYRYGKGVEKDMDEAFRLLVIAAEAGCKQAMLGLAEFYEHGLAGECDYDLSDYWTNMAEDTPAHCYYQYVDPEHLPHLPESYYTAKEEA